MELKVICDCGQKYAFDVEPVNEQMPFAVNCPACGIDGTDSANALLAEVPASSTPPAPPAARISTPRETPAPPMAPRAAPSSMRAPAPVVPGYLRDNPKMMNNSFPMGILGAFLGAFVAVALMVGFTIFAGFRFPLLGTVMGAIIGFGARLLYRGTSSSLGFVAAAVAFVTVGGTLYLLFGLIGTLLTGFISLVVGVSLAFKIASD